MDRNGDKEQGKMTHDIEKEDNGFKINGGIKTTVVLLWAVLAAVNAYAYFYKFPVIEQDIKKNTKQVHKIDVVLSEIKGIKEDIREFKIILRRTSPYERDR